MLLHEKPTNRHYKVVMENGEFWSLWERHGESLTVTTKDRDRFLVEMHLFSASTIAANFTIQNLMLHFATTSPVSSAP